MATEPDDFEKFTAAHFLHEAEKCLDEFPTSLDAKPAFRFIGCASFIADPRNTDHAEHALRILDRIICLDKALTLNDVGAVAGECSNMGDECGVRLVSSMSVPRDALIIEPHLINRIGPRTLRSLLDKGADAQPKGAAVSPLQGLLDHTSPVNHHSRIPLSAMLLGAGADPTDVRVPRGLAEPFQRLRDLRALSALYAAPNLAVASAAWFVRLDGDLAIAHRVHAFLAPSELALVNSR
jgi:hypothetical protein